MIRSSFHDDLLARVTAKDSLGEYLSRSRRVTSSDGHICELKLVGNTARLERETASGLRITIPLDLEATEESLTQQSALPGNLRFALEQNTAMLVADLIADGTSAFARRIAELGRGIKLALGRKPHNRGESEFVSAEALREALLTCGLPAEQVVQLEGTEQWELRLGLQSRMVPVRVTVHNGAIRVCRPVLRLPADKRSRQALALRSLKLNGELRGARFTIDDDWLIAESRTPGGPCVGSQIVELGRAVAAAYWHGRPSLELLANEPQVVDGFLAMFGDCSSRPR